MKHTKLSVCKGDLPNSQVKNNVLCGYLATNDDVDGQHMVGDLHVVASEHRETRALKLIVIYIAAIQN